MAKLSTELGKPLSTLPCSDITGLILAGGRGRRMGLVDKGLQSFNNRPLCAEVIQRLQPQVAGVIINANQNLARYQAFGFPVWPDQTADFAGPLAGMQSGLRHCQTPYLLTVPCDSPFLPADLAMRLSHALLQQNALLAVAVNRDPVRDCEQMQPVFCLMSIKLLPNLNDFLAQGGRKIEAWIAQLSEKFAASDKSDAAVVRVLFDDERAFCNLNTLAALQQAEMHHTEP